MSQSKITQFFAARGKAPPAPPVVIQEKKILPVELWQVVLEFAPDEDMLWLEHRIKLMTNPAVVYEHYQFDQRAATQWRTLLTLHHGCEDVWVYFDTNLQRIFNGIKPVVRIEVPRNGRRMRKLSFVVGACHYTAAWQLLDLFRRSAYHTCASCLRPRCWRKLAKKRWPGHCWASAPFNAPSTAEALAKLPLSLLTKGDH